MAVNRGRIVIDASLAINMVLTEQPYHREARNLAQYWDESNIELIAPPLYESEVDGVIRGNVYRENMTRDLAEAVQQLLDALPVIIVQDSRVRRRAREIAAGFNQARVYDSTYAALAEIAGCDFWTADRNYYEAVRNGLTYVKFVGEFVDGVRPLST